DIDANDYESRRHCCLDRKTVCRQCWMFMAAAVRITDTCLRDEFGYTRILWAFSGRRGVHCWVMDDDVGSLTSEERHHILGHMSTPRNPFYGVNELLADHYPWLVTLWNRYFYDDVVMTTWYQYVERWLRAK